MAKYLQYDQKTEAPFTATPSAYPDRWHQAWSGPVRQRIVPALAIAIAASGLFAPAFTPPATATVVAPATITSDVIYPRSFIYQSKTEPVAVPTVATAITGTALSSPVYFKSRFIYQSQAKPVLPPTVTTAVATTALSSPVFFKGDIIYQSYTKPVLPPTVTTSEDQWHQPWSEPVRTRKFGPQLQDVGTPDVPRPPTVLVSQWYEPWTDPARRKGVSVALHQSLIWSNFTPAAAAPTYFNLTQGDTGLIFQKTLIYQVNTDPIGVTAPFTYLPWSEPVRLKGPHPSLQQAFISPNFTPTVTPPAVTAVTVDTFTDQVVYPRSFIYQSQTKPYFPIAAQATVVTTTSLSSPIFFKGRLIYQSYTKPVFTQPVAAPTDIKWLYPWSEPVRVKKLATAQQQSLAWSNFTPPPPAIVTSALSSPVFFKGDIIYQSYTKPVFTQPVVAPTDIKWLYQWSEPVRQKPGLNAGLQQAFSAPSKVIPRADTLTATALSSPVFFKGRLIYQSYVLPPFPPTTPTITVGNWFSEWPTPTRSKVTVSSATFDFINVDQGLLNYWYAPWPDFAKGRSFPVAQQQALAWSNFTPPTPAVADIKWIYPWSEPVRWRQFNTALQQPLAFVALLKNASNTASPYYPWSEPVRLKPGLKTYLQSFTSLVTPPQPNFIRTINWYQPWTEPVRLKKGIRPELQQFTAFGTPRITSQVTLTMSAFEINLDQFLAGVIVTDVIPPSPPAAIVGANVSIKEIPLISGSAVSIEET